MSLASRFDRLIALLREELHHHVRLNPSERRWQLPLAAALATGLPLLLGAHFDRLAESTIASLGGMVFLYTPNSPLSHRMATVMACALGMIASFTLGLLAAAHSALLIPVLTLLATLATATCRAYKVGPPGSLFLFMAAAIAAYMPFDLALLPFRVGLMALGCLGATSIALLYSLYMLHVEGHPVAPAAPIAPHFDEVVTDALIIGLSVGASLLVAHGLGLSRPYWVPVSCLAVILSANIRMAWNKQVQRILGTGLGLGLTWWLLSRHMNPWQICGVMMLLNFIIEFLVVRHYALAVIFITPLTILLADIGAGMAGDIPALMASRFWDSVLGSLLGLGGGLLIHSQWVHQRLRGMRKAPLE